MKKLFLAAFLQTCIILCFAQLKSPDEFLGYQLGIKWTPHFKIVNYFNYTASNSPFNMKLEKYGETNEGKDLLLAIISSPQNMSRIEEIRKNNLRLAGIEKGNVFTTNAPTIIWLSYNVHGNETSSSEVAMKVLYELTNTKNLATQKWLENTIVIIDPCLNPDGRDRYVNWYNSQVGKTPNANVDSREHSEPWPGGRTNHYNFDLNRDWAWQTQVETQQRLKKYNEWMPQIHCDFHEQGINNTYYFAPAAEPFHEVITPWQRDFQTTIGKNHAKYFDANGWFYFTKEIFDLFYPSYGDTYPMYNGAIGMTYEQAGHSSGGLTVIKNDGDTLTLKDRIAHHFTTSMSTIEMASVYQTKLISEFQNYFTKAKNIGYSSYKSFVIKGDDTLRRNAFLNILEKNEIIYTCVAADRTVTANGFEYNTGKENAFSITKGDIIIQNKQSKSSMVKVLLEPQTKLSDSATYDITAWSLPYVYGLNAFACKNEIPNGEEITITKISNRPTSYGYAFKWSGVNAASFLGKLLQKNCVLKFAEQPFLMGNENFERGTILVLPSTKNNMNDIMQLASANSIQLYDLNGGMVNKGFDFGSEKNHLLKKKNVVLLTGKGVDANAAGEVWHFFEQQLNYPITLINADEISDVSLKNIDVLILPNGRYKFLSDKDVSADLKTWVRQGGKIVAIDNAVAQMANGDWGIKIKKTEEEKKDDKNIYADVKKYENRKRDGVAETIPGAIYKVEMDDTHPLAFGYNKNYFTLKQNDNVYEFMKDGWNVGIVKKENQVAGFVGSKLKNKIKDGTVLAVQPMGNGSIIYFADDPIFRSFWENGKLLFSNAVFLVGQ